MHRMIGPASCVVLATLCFPSCAGGPGYGQEPAHPIAPPAFTLPTPRWTTYEFTWQAPGAQPAKPVALTVAVVRPFAADKESTFADPAYRKLAKGFAQSMGVDLDKVLVAKGFKVSGPHETWDDMTYADKQSADIALTPRMFLTAEVRNEAGQIVGGQPPAGGGGDSGGGGARPLQFLFNSHRPDGRHMLLAAAGGALPLLAARATAAAPCARKPCGAEPDPAPAPLPAGPAYIERRFTMVVQGHIAAEIREPLSNQKLWVKKLELESLEMKGVEYFEGPAGAVTGTAAEPDASAKLLFDGKQEAMADIMQSWYPAVMKKVWTYLDVAELLNLKPQVEEIRKSKRY